MVESSVPDPINFHRTGPFFEHVIAFSSAICAMEPLVDARNPLGYYLGQPGIAIEGNVHSKFVLDTHDLWLKYQTQQVTHASVTAALCRMLIVTSYETVSQRLNATPVEEYFRHIRNASAHRGTFRFFPKEPSRPAAWRGLALDESLKGAANPLAGVECFFKVLGPADAVLLLWDVEQGLSLNQNAVA